MRMTVGVDAGVDCATTLRADAKTDMTVDSTTMRRRFNYMSSQMAPGIFRLLRIYAVNVEG